MSKNLYTRYAALKKQVAGNHEKSEFEWTFGPTVQEKAKIQGMSKPNRRILAQLLYALELSKRHDGKYDNEVAAALTLLEQAMLSEGVLTKSICQAAETILLPLKDAAKEYKVIYASHAHIDMNWQWGWQETVAITLSTFRTMLNLMQEYPEFTFSQSQASVYKIVEEHDPDMMQEIQDRIREGRWEVTANAWVETDKNMPDTESLIRHVAETRKYLQKVWGVPADKFKVDFSPDTFGHSAHIPEINTFCEVPYYYHCRGLQEDVTLYRYKAPSGNEILMYKEPYWYNSGVNPDNGTGVFEMERRCAGMKTALIVYGVGNHGGGPTRRDIETMLEMQQWPIFPTLKFGTLHEFFAEAESVREKLPVIDHELNAIFTGCYTTQSRIKLGNRRAETGLLESETMNALAHFTVDGRLAGDRYTKAWQKVLFTHFHDILTGSGVQETREHAMGKLAEAIAYAQTEQNKAYERLSQNIDTSMFPVDGDIADTRSEGGGGGFGIASYAGVPNPERGAGRVRIYTVFNPGAVSRKELVELTVWDYSGDIHRLEAIDHTGNPVSIQLLDTEPQWYWDHYYIRVLLEADVPALGYAAYALKEKEITDYPTHLLNQEREELPKDNMILENENLAAKFDTGSGMMISLYDKKEEKELLGAPAGLHLVHTENGGMTSWRIGRYLTMEPVCDTIRATPVDGTLRSSITFEQKVMHSTVKMIVSLDKGAAALKYDLTVDWHETCTGQEYIPVLTYRLSLKEKADTILCDVPAGRAERPARQIDVPALTGACPKAEGTTAALITDCKYGYRLADNVLSATLINTAGDPDPYPERGIHAIKLFVALTEGNKAASLKNAAKALISPMLGVPTAHHDGKLEPKAAIMEIDAEHTVVSSIQVGEDDSLVLRLYETDGEEDIVIITPPFEIGKAEVVNLNGEKLGTAVCGTHSATIAMLPNTIRQIRIYKA